jgi:hypothetical protein
MNEADPSPGDEPLRLRVLHEILEQSARLATGAALMCAIVASANHDPGADLARALAVYLARLALPVFLLSYCLNALGRMSPAGWIAVLLSRRGTLDAAVRALFLVHWAAVAAYLYVAKIVPSSIGVVGGTVGAMAILLRPALAVPRDARAEFRYSLAGDAIWLVYAAFYVRVLGNAGPARFSTPGQASVFLAVLTLALALRVWGRAR